MAAGLSRRAVVLIRCDGSKEIGLGHVSRCLALAAELTDRHGCDPVFVMQSATLGAEIVHRAGRAVVELAASDDDASAILEIVDQRQARRLILDVRQGISRNDVLELRAALPVAVIDDPGDRRLAADAVFYPPIPQMKRWTWEGFSGRLNTGWKWVILRPGFAMTNPRSGGEPPTLLVTMGGTDPSGMTARVLRALEALKDLNPIIVLGGGPAGESAAARLRAGGRHVEFLTSSVNMAGLMRRVDFAVTSFGVTAYELAAAGVPAVYLCLTDDHAESATALVDAGVGLSLGTHTGTTDRAIADAVVGLGDVNRRRAMAERGPALIDGRGAARVADYIMNDMER